MMFSWLTEKAFWPSTRPESQNSSLRRPTRLEQAAALTLTGRAREFLKERRVLEPAEFRIAHMVGEQRARAREHIFRRVVGASVPNDLAGTLEELLVVKPDEDSSGLQAIKANPGKPSVDAMREAEQQHSCARVTQLGIVGSPCYRKSGR